MHKHVILITFTITDSHEQNYYLSQPEKL